MYIGYDNFTGISLREIKTSLGSFVFPVFKYNVPFANGDQIQNTTTPLFQYEFSIFNYTDSINASWNRTLYPNESFSIDNSNISILNNNNTYQLYFNGNVLSSDNGFTDYDTRRSFIGYFSFGLLEDINGKHVIALVAGIVETADPLNFAQSGTEHNQFGYAIINGCYFGYPFGQIVRVNDNTNVLAGEQLYNNSEDRTTDPYEPEGESEGHVGGEGTHEEESDPIPIPPEPTLSAANTNFIRLYNPTLSELQSLANYMWSDLFDLNSFKKIFSDPISCILGLSIVPVAIRNGGISSVVLGNIDTEVQMNRALSQYETVDCGSLTISEYWGAYLDYSPYTKFELYLPYIGTRPISADDIMGKIISVIYRVDILSGSCVAYVKCDNSVLYSFIGQCSSSIPITGNDWTNVINGALNIAGAVGTLVATGGFSAPAQIAGTAAGTAYQAKHLMSTGASIAQNVMSMKPQIEKSGSLSGTGGMLGVQKPYLIITRPRQALPARQNHYLGYPSFVTVRLGDVSGYTEIDAIHLENIPATSDELNEIERLLKGGVIL